MGAWNVVGKRLLTPGTIHPWAFVVFDARAREEVVERFISTLTTCLRKLGALLRPLNNSRSQLALFSLAGLSMSVYTRRSSKILMFKF